MYFTSADNNSQSHHRRGKGSLVLSIFLSISSFHLDEFCIFLFLSWPHYPLHSRLLAPDSKPGAPAALTGLRGHACRVFTEGWLEGPALYTAWRGKQLSVTTLSQLHHEGENDNHFPHRTALSRYLLTDKSESKLRVLLW